MATYTPDASNVDRPTGGDVVQITEELRAIKVRIGEETAGKMPLLVPRQVVNPTGSTGATATGATTINLATGTFQHINVVADTTLTFTAPTLANNEVPFFVLRVTGGGNYIITWPANTRWSTGLVPILSTGTDMLVFYKPYPSANFWEGILVGSDMREVV